jgi:hypothetical protein
MNVQIILKVYHILHHQKSPSKYKEVEITQLSYPIIFTKAKNTWEEEKSHKCGDMNTLFYHQWLISQGEVEIILRRMKILTHTFSQHMKRHRVQEKQYSGENFSEKYLLKKKKYISNQQPNFIPKRMKKAAEKLNLLSVEERS